MPKTRRQINSIAPWYGSKRTLAPRIVQELGRHRAYFEPFAGSCAVLLAKPPCSLETVSDLHGDLINLAIVLASSRWEELYSQAMRTLYVEPLVEDWARRVYDEPASPPASPDEARAEHVQRACQWLATVWIGRNGHAGCKPSSGAKAMATRWTATGGSGPVRWASVADSIPAWHERLRTVTILRRDGFEVLGKIADHKGTAIYVDPPYIVSSRGKSADSYEHDFTEQDHCRLAEALGRFQKARVAVSYYDCPQVRRLYSGWTVRDLACNKNLSVQASQGAQVKQAQEILLTNGPSLAKA